MEPTKKYKIEYYGNKVWGDPEQGQEIVFEEDYEGTMTEAREHANGKAYDIACDQDRSIDYDIYEPPAEDADA